MQPDPTDPHLVDEDPEECIGDVTPDPWSDETQTDWPQGDEEVTDDGELDSGSELG